MQLTLAEPLLLYGAGKSLMPINEEQDYTIDSVWP